MEDKIIKYANLALLLASLSGLAWGAVKWVPDTFMTRVDALEMLEAIEEGGKERDKEIHKAVQWNYLETQIRLNSLLIRDMQKRLNEGTLSIEDQIMYNALKDSQGALIKKRNEFAQSSPDWLND